MAMLLYLGIMHAGLFSNQHKQNDATSESKVPSRAILMEASSRAGQPTLVPQEVVVGRAGLGEVETSIQ